MAANDERERRVAFLDLIGDDGLNNADGISDVLWTDERTWVAGASSSAHADVRMEDGTRYIVSIREASSR